MRRARVVYRPEAAQDVEDIFRYVLERSGDAMTAARYTDRIRARCDRIGDAPLGGLARDDLAPNLRLAAFERQAAIVYRIERDVVEIVNVFHGGRDYEAIFRNRG